MFTTLLAVIVALALGHLAPQLASRLRRFGWFDRWMRWLEARAAEDGFWHGRFGIGIALLPPLLLVALLQIAAHATLYGLPSLLLGIAALFYAWGPDDLDMDVDMILEARDTVERRQAAGRLWPPGEPVSLGQAALVGALFRCGKRRWFGVLLWFLLLGPVGALLYRLVAIAAEGNATHFLSPSTLEGARALLRVLDWPVAQLMVAAMALVGNYDAVLTAWKSHRGASFDTHADFLAAAACASVRREQAADRYEDDDVAARPPGATAASAHELSGLRDGMRLAWRILLVWLAVLAVFVVAGWVS